jgi:hypothetical protein
VKKLITTSLLIFLVPMILALAAASPDYQGTQRFREILVTGPANFDGAVDFDDTVNFTGATVSDLTLADNLTVAAGGLTVTAGGATLTDGDLTIADFTRIVPQDTITLTDGGVLTPTGSMQPISAAGTISVTLNTVCTAGQELTVLNLVAQAITISETTITDQLSGNAVLNQYDNLQLVCAPGGNVWVETAQVDN